MTAADKPEAAARAARDSGAELGAQAALRVLVVENSRLTARMVSRAIAETCHRDCTIAGTLAEARQILATQASEHIAAVVGLELPDASGAGIVELTLSYGLPTIVLTASWDDATRACIWDHDVFDYYLKDEEGLRAVCRAVQRLPLNPAIKVLVVDDSALYRTLEVRLLRAQGFEVLVAHDGLEALAVLEAHPDVSLVVTDYEMPNLDGMELVSRIRRKSAREEVAVMGISSLGTTATSVGFLKHGANDFLPKPFQKEEFYCRIYTCIDTVENMRAIQRAAFTDGLTGLRNRLSFFRKAPEAFAQAVEQQLPLAVAMLDIDFFKKVNDTYGHAAGDAVLRQVAQTARRHLEKHGLFARFGGEEFCFLGIGLARDVVQAAFEAVRAEVEAAVVRFEGQEIRVTISQGVALRAGASLDETLGRADALLYEAKHGGRNRVVLEA